jgi:integrase/recombinase XerD
MGQARTINEKQAKTLFSFIGTQRNAKRNKAMFALSYYSGLRAKEIASLTIGNVLKADNSIKDVVYLNAEQTKGSKGREFYINASAKQHLSTLIKSMRNVEPSFPLLQVMGRRKAFSANSLAIALRNIYLSAGFTNCSSHTGRRSSISQLANKGVGIRIIQKFSGHKQLQSVQNYLDANEEMVKNAVELVK